MDYKKPINIDDVNNTALKYQNILKGLNMLKLNDVLVNCTPVLGVTDSIKLGKVEHGTLAKKYTGTFSGDVNMGKVVPRTLTVYPVVGELADEPERYRRSFIDRVAGNLWNPAHPFELWITQFGLDIISEEMFYAMFKAKYQSSALKTTLNDSFDSWNSIIDADIVAGNVAAGKGNYYEGDADISRSNAGDYMLDFVRTRHSALRDMNTNMWIGFDVADAYDAWYQDEHERLPFTDTSGQEFLEGTNKKVRIIRTPAIPSGSKRIFLTTRENMVYGTDSLADLKSLKAFPSGNPYLFTQSMKFVWGCQFVSVNEREFAVNDLAAYGSGSN